MSDLLSTAFLNPAEVATAILEVIAVAEELAVEQSEPRWRDEDQPLADLGCLTLSPDELDYFYRLAARDALFAPVAGLRRRQRLYTVLSLAEVTA